MRGRAVPSYPAGRIEAAVAIKAEHEQAIRAALATLPRRVRLDDGRKLHMAYEVAGGLAYRCTDGMAVLASYDPTPHGMLLHVSVSYADREPRWSDLRAVRGAFFPADRDVIQVLPCAGEYVNVHQYCLHLFAAPETWQGGWNV